MRPFAYARAATVEEAVSALDSGCRPLAGGTELLRLMKAGLVAPERLVSIRGIPGLADIERLSGSWHLGALSTLSQLAHGRSLGQHLPVLQQAARESASPQLRQMATLGGNLVQRPHCWYYRKEGIQCWLKGGDRCFALDGENQRHALFGGGPCYAVHPSDPAVALLALDASVEMASPGGTRQVPVAGFFRQPHQEAWSETALALDELITGIAIPAQPAGARGTYVKVAERAVWDFALVSAAVQLTFDGERVAQARVALGGVAPVPWRSTDAEDAVSGRRLTDEAIRDAAHAATADAEPLSQNGYKVDLIRGVVAEALRRLR
jgi:xanthine dehydrogenase YagS FAD-binding subunit